MTLLRPEVICTVDNCLVDALLVELLPVALGFLLKTLSQVAN